MFVPLSLVYQTRFYACLFSRMFYMCSYMCLHFAIFFCICVVFSAAHRRRTEMSMKGRLAHRPGRRSHSTVPDVQRTSDADVPECTIALVISCYWFSHVLHCSWTTCWPAYEPVRSTPPQKKRFWVLTCLLMGFLLFCLENVSNKACKMKHMQKPAIWTSCNVKNLRDKKPAK